MPLPSVKGISVLVPPWMTSPVMVPVVVTPTAMVSLRLGDEADVTQVHWPVVVVPVGVAEVAPSKKLCCAALSFELAHTASPLPVGTAASTPLKAACP